MTVKTVPEKFEINEDEEQKKPKVQDVNRIASLHHWRDERNVHRTSIQMHQMPFFVVVVVFVSRNPGEYVRRAAKMNIIK